MNDVTPVGELPKTQRVRFSGAEGALFRILLRGSLLQIPTFGFYRFWLITDVRRHLWSHTQLGGDAFEYSGRGRELLIGFLIALAILAPIYVVFFLLTLEAERLQAFASVPLVAILYVLGYYAAYRARRYRATRTIFRGVRFWMTGSGWAYAGRAILWDLATILTLGLAYPWRSAALERYKMKNTRYGTIVGDFAGRGATLFRRGAWLWVLFLLLVVCGAAVAAAESWGWLIVVVVVTIPVALLLLPVFTAIELRWWLEGVRIGPVEAASDLRVGTILWCFGKTVLIWIAYSSVGGIIVALFLTILAGIYMSAVGMTPGQMQAPSLPVTIVGSIVVGLAYIGFFLGFDIIRRLYLDRGIWTAAAGSVTLTHLHALDAVLGAGGEVPGGLGEGLLDALDMGGGV
jgi:uncharacterized membrane protein YjgN (DUF898 family)